jgi:hypothetical protein
MHPQVWGVVGLAALFILALPALTKTNSRTIQIVASKLSASSM